MATLETLPLIFVFLYLFAYTLGAFGSIHTAIKYSIGARTYTFETFRNRTNLTYFRDRDSAGVRNHYRQNGNRFHGIQAVGVRSGEDFKATRRAIRMGVPIDPGASDNDPELHNNAVHQSEELAYGRRNSKVEVSPMWVMVAYGICLDKKCGGD